MSFEPDLKAHLQAASAVSDIVGDRIFPNIVRQGSAMPCITYTLFLGELQDCLDGFTSGVTRYLVQLDCWALTYREVIALGIAVRDRMNVVASTFSTRITNYPSFDDFESDTQRYRRTVEVSCMFKE